jgi:sulfite exporter TauE/SafE
MMDSATPLLLSALLLGFFGSVHCLAMCGGIAGALGQTQSDASVSGGWSRALLYSTGRIASYSVAGAAVGSLGEAFATQTGLAIVLRCLAGLLIAVFGLHVAGWWNGITSLERAGMTIWRRVAPLARRVGRPDRAWKVFTLGMLWGWLPCGLVYSALAAAASAGRAEVGMAFMLCFGLGTLPALVSTSAMSSQLARLLAARSARRLAGAVLLCFGIWSIAGAVLPHLGGDSHHGTHHGQGSHAGA